MARLGFFDETLRIEAWFDPVVVTDSPTTEEGWFDEDLLAAAAAGPPTANYIIPTRRGRRR